MDPGQFREVTEIKIDPLYLRYAHTQIRRLIRALAMAGSIDRFGPILPIIGLRVGMNSFVLIDGTLRE